MDILGWQLILQVILIALNAVFACAEIAVLSFNDTKLEKLAEDGNKKAKRLSKLTAQPARFLATIQVAITLAGFLGSAFAAENFASRIVDWLVGLGVGIAPSTLNTIAVVVVTLILSYITLVFGELVPKRVAMKKTEAIALGLSGIVGFISKAFAPLVWLLTVSTNGVLRLMGIDPNSEENEVSEEEIRMLVDAGSENGAIGRDEQEIIQNVFEFDDLTAGEIATHRTDIEFLWAEDDDATWEKVIFESKHTLYPVCDESVDNVVGVLNSKEYFRLADKSRASVMENAVRVPYFVPEGVTADILFRNMKRTRNHFAVVVDEYGGTTGIVTINDLVELLVGDLEDDEEAAAEEPTIEKLEDGRYAISGGMTLDEVAEVLDVELPVDEYETFGGYVFGLLGSIPDDGTTFEMDTDDLHIVTTHIEDHRIEATIVTRKQKPESEEDDD